MANSHKSCKHCKKSVRVETMTTRQFGNFCSVAHSLAWIDANSKRLADKARTNREKLRRKETKERMIAIKTASQWRSEAQASVNKYIRIRDLHDGCISCGKSRQEVEVEQGWKIGGCWDAGHYQGRGKKGQLRFVLFNINKQCKSCNGGSGKYSHKADTVEKQYRVKLIDKIGLDKVEWLENNNELDHHRNDIEYLKRVKKIFSKKYRIYLKRFR